VHQSGPFDMMLPALDNLRTAARYKGLRWRDVRRQVDDLLTAFGLDGKTGQLTFTLSGGERRRLQVIRALLGDPPLLLLDEPSAGLDVGARRQVWSLLHELRRRHGTTMLWTSHYVEEVERNCRRVLVVDHGRLVEFAAPRELAERFGGQVALVRPERPQDTDALLALLGQAQPPLRVTTGEGEVEVRGQGMRARLPALLTRAETLGIGIGAVEYRTPSLEDAFLTLVGAGHDG
ncbi:MAG: ABC transporter ATP-binding protein, partial [Streptomyces sp.]|nr:ABC transporter ATP-binding protein [Streptomyces sp.]